MGHYEEEKHPMVIRSMVTIPGCEGRAFRLRESVAVFGLGFHGLAALCVLDHLEADTVYAFLGISEGAKEYAERTRNNNRELIENPKTKAVLEWPLESLETAYRQLAETIGPHRPDGEITLVPMGPKPQVLASILVAMRFPEVACLRVSGSMETQDVAATGETVATRVIVKSDS
jgi:threonine dehydrogenase-like Zn-dependent dehydrogenase